MRPHDVMEECVSLALLGKGYTKTNPIVGAAIVKDEQIIARGWHMEFGGPHAEINALADAGEDARGADLYVTLEPCSTHGKTPPCTEAIVKAGIKRVFIGVADPNPAHAGRGIKYLLDQGVEVFLGFAEEMCANIIEDFTKFITTGKPYFSMKVAQSLDGKIATRSGDSKWITGVSAREYVHYLRSVSDAVLVGIGTVLADDPMLDVRLINSKKQPQKIVLDSFGRIPENAAVVTNHPERLIVITGEGLVEDQAKMTRLQELGVRVLAVPAENGKLDLDQAAALLGQENLLSVLVEGGSEVFGSFLDQKLVDRTYFFIAPKIIGGTEATTSVGGMGIDLVKNAQKLGPCSMQRFEDDMLVSCRMSNYTSLILETTSKLGCKCSLGL